MFLLICVPDLSTRMIYRNRYSFPHDYLLQCVTRHGHCHTGSHRIYLVWADYSNLSTRTVTGLLTHWGRDNMAAISQTIFYNTFSWIKMLKFPLKKSTEICSQGSNWQHSSTGLDNGLAPNRRQAIIWTNDVLGCRRIYGSLGLNGLIFIHISQVPCRINRSHTATSGRSWLS